MTTHYALYFSRPHPRADLRDTPCGRTIPRAESTTTPSCPACQAYLAAEAEDTRTADDLFGADEPVTTIVAVPDRDARQEFDQHYDRRFGGRGR